MAGVGTLCRVEPMMRPRLLPGNQFASRRLGFIRLGTSESTDMNSRLRTSTWTSKVRKGGRIDLPPDVPDFHLGQRIYFHVTHLGAVFGVRPTRTENGRLLSSRVRRGLRSIAAYGPRTPGARSRAGRAAPPTTSLRASRTRRIKF